MNRKAFLTFTLLLLSFLVFTAQPVKAGSSGIGTTVTSTTETIYATQEPLFTYGKILSGTFNATRTADGVTQTASAANYTVAGKQLWRATYYYVLQFTKLDRNIVNATYTVQGRTGNNTAWITLYNFKTSTWVNTTIGLGTILTTGIGHVDHALFMDRSGYLYIGLTETGQTTQFTVNIDYMTLEVTYQTVVTLEGSVRVTLNPGTTIWVKVDLTTMNRSIRCFGLPSLANNSGFGGADFMGTVASTASGHIWLGAYTMIPPSGVSLPPDQYAVSPCTRYVKLMYVGQQAVSGNFTLILSIGTTDPFENVVWYPVNVKPSPEVTIIQAPTLVIEGTTLVTLIAGIVSAVALIWGARMYNVRHGHFQE